MRQFYNMIVKKKLCIYMWIPIYTPISKPCKEEKKLATNLSSTINNLSFWPPTIPTTQRLQFDIAKEKQNKNKSWSLREKHTVL